jgi:hypothetical protein
MNINELVSKPKPRKFEVNTPEIIEKYGSPMEFYMMWPMSIEQFAGLSKMNNIELVTEVLVNEDGSKVFTDGVSLDGFLLVGPIASLIWETLGK